MISAILGQARAAISSALPGYADVTGDPNPQSLADLPVFHVEIAGSGGELAAMGAPDQIEDVEVTVTLRGRVASGGDATATGWAVIDLISPQIAQSMWGLSGVLGVTLAPAQVEAEAAEARIFSAERQLQVRYFSQL